MADTSDDDFFYGSFFCESSQNSKSLFSSPRLAFATSVNRISVLFEVAERSEPSTIFARPDLAACVIWSN